MDDVENMLKTDFCIVLRPTTTQPFGEKRLFKIIVVYIVEVLKKENLWERRSLYISPHQYIFF